MHEIEELQARLASAGDLADALAAGWDSFAFVQVVADDYAGREFGMFAAFMFAAAAAVAGRDAVGFAPSMPATVGAAPSPAGSDAADADEVADSLTGLASALRYRLVAVAEQARDPGDREACEQAARAAGRIGELLAPARLG